MIDMKALGKNLSECRQKKGLTQEVLSGLADVDRSHLSKIELGLMNPTIDTLYKITDTLEIRLSDILRKAEDETSNHENE